MQFSKRLASWQGLAVGLLVCAGAIGVPALLAQDDNCPRKNICPAPVVLEKPQVQPADTCCPVDPKEVKRAQKEAEHAQHELEEETAKQQARRQKSKECLAMQDCIE